LIGLDCAPAYQPATGVAVYVRELAVALEAEAPDRVAWLGVRRRGPLDHGMGPQRTYFRDGHHLLWLAAHGARDARALGCRLVHWTNGVAPPRATRIPSVVTVHDLSILRKPLSHPVLRLAAIPFLVGGARRAARVIVPSEATARDVRRLLRVASNRIAVIPHAPRAIGSGESASPALEPMGLEPGQFILSVGTLEPRKNHVRLLEAFERLAPSHPRLRLVLVGRRGWGNGVFDRALRTSSVRDRIVVPGYVDDERLAVLLREAAVVAYVSLLEGYGLPVIEAMAAGTPVVTSRASALREVAGDAAVLVDPLKPGSIAEGILEAIENRVFLVAAGRTRADSRTWGDVARDTLLVYGEALASVSP
jgi:glycosyltransferase involved in cell wall biosynthesis